MHEAVQEPCDGCIDIEELIAFIDEWRHGIVNISELMVVIGFWKVGC